MMVGNVKWFDVRKGYGFILGPQGEDVFVHYSNIEGLGFRALREGEHVEFELTQTPKGLAAHNVHAPPPAVPPA